MYMPFSENTGATPATLGTCGHKLHIAFVSDKTFDPNKGGVRRVTDNLARALKSRGFSVFYYTLDKAEEGVRYPAQQHSAPSQDYRSLEVIRDYQSFLLSNHIDVVINQSGQSPESELFLNTGKADDVRVISVIHSSPFWDYHHLWYLRTASLKKKSPWGFFRYLELCLSNPWKKRKARRSWKKHYASLLQNRGELCLLSRRYFDDLSILHLDFGKRLHAISNANTYAEPVHVDWESKQKEVLYVGRLTQRDKQPYLLMNIWSKVEKLVPDWKLTVVGPDEDHLVWQEAQRLHLQRVEFCGRQDPLPYYRRASIFCLCSMFEGFPMVLTEAQQNGVATIAFDSFAAVRDIITDGETGVLVTPFSADEYAHKLLKLIQHDDTRLQMAKAARQSVQRFSQERIVEEWISLLTSPRPS